MFAARRLRPKEPPTTRRARRRRWALEIIDLLAAAITVALRRADWIALAIVFGLCGVALGLELTVPGTSG